MASKKKVLSFKILVVDDEVGIADMLKSDLESKGDTVETAYNQEEALTLFKRKRFDFALLDLKLPSSAKDMASDMEVGFDTLAKIRQKYNKDRFPVIVMTAHGGDGHETAVRTINAGANDYIKKPFNDNSISLEDKIEIIKTFLTSTRRSRSVRYKSGESDTIIGKSRELREVISLARQVAQSDARVVITGETGTGKELIAQEIHEESTRKDGPFVVCDCTCLPGELVGSELFGIEAGTATGVEGREGKIESANGGTLFLDEIAELPLNQQAILLRVLNDGKVQRIGSREAPKVVDFRLIAATNKDLQQMVKDKTFKEDLFYRIKVFPITLPPLRERIGDIPDLVRHFVSRYSKDGKRISNKAMAKLKTYSWPGNVRELENIIQRALIHCGTTRTISEDHIKLDLPSEKVSIPRPVIRQLKNDRQKMLYGYIQENGRIGNQEAQEFLKVSNKTVYTDFKYMVDEGILVKNGTGKGTFYTLIKELEEG